MAAFRDHSVRIPEDVSIAGFDDIRTLRDFVPQLTTVHSDLEELGERAAALALDGAAGRPGSTGPRRGQVVLRDSTRRLS